MSELEPVISDLRHFVAERDWSKYHDPKNLAMLLASEAGELLALFRWVSNDEADRFARDDDSRRKIAAEVGDVAISLLLFCDRVGLDLADAARAKLDVNRRNYPVEKVRGKAHRVRKE